uniref:Uncharacterized protein n=1 Tax=Rhizophagus irregularis (strain DAOM 181602 / DAOM 197198 / MUCL 43194) TaxID=747089 RepID=U9TC12_RHIID
MLNPAQLIENMLRISCIIQQLEPRRPVVIAQIYDDLSEGKALLGCILYKNNFEN